MKAYGIALLAALWASPAIAQTGNLDLGALQVVGLFLQACIGNKADPAAVRDWMNNHHVPRLKDEALPSFINNRPGIGYDALTSEDNGVCSVYAENAKDDDVIKSLKAYVPNSQRTLVRLQDHSDAKDPKLHHYDYVVISEGTPYDLVVSTDAVPGHIQAMLSFWRRGPNEGPITSSP